MGFDLYSRGSATYFRLTTWAMHEYVRYFVSVGVVENEWRRPDFPIHTPGLDAETPDWPHDAPFSDEELAALGFPALKPGMVPGVKLTTNECWLVTPPECDALAVAAESIEEDSLNPHGEDYYEVLRRLGEFCGVSAAEGGFWVL